MQTNTEKKPNLNEIFTELKFMTTQFWDQHKSTLTNEIDFFDNIIKTLNNQNCLLLDSKLYDLKKILDDKKFFINFVSPSLVSFIDSAENILNGNFIPIKKEISSSILKSNTNSLHPFSSWTPTLYPSAPSARQEDYSNIQTNYYSESHSSFAQTFINTCDSGIFISSQQTNTSSFFSFYQREVKQLTLLEKIERVENKNFLISRIQSIFKHMFYLENICNSIDSSLINSQQFSSWSQNLSEILLALDPDIFSKYELNKNIKNSIINEAQNYQSILNPYYKNTLVNNNIENITKEMELFFSAENLCGKMLREDDNINRKYKDYCKKYLSLKEIIIKTLMPKDSPKELQNSETPHYDQRFSCS